MLNGLVQQLLIMPVWRAAMPLIRKWSGAPQWLHDFLNLFFLMLAPGLILSAPICFGAQGFLGAKTSSRRMRLLIALLTAPAYLLLSCLWNAVGLSGFTAPQQMSGTFLISALAALPTSAFSVLGFWIPLLVTGLYTTLAKTPRWWWSALIGTAAVLLGLWAHVILGLLVGAETD